MHLISQMLALSSELPEVNQVVLTAERRQFLKRRWRGIAEDGTEFGFDLQTRLIDGCVIFHAENKDFVVRQQVETVYEVSLKNTSTAAHIGWKIGNLHLPAEIFSDRIRVLHDDAMRQLLEREDWNFTEPQVVFTPMKSMAHP